MAGPSISGATGIGAVLLSAYRRADIHVQNWAGAFFRMPWPSYVLVALLQLKVIWNIWRFRDLTSGDTSSYFVSAYSWYEGLRDNFAWSPLYTSFYGTVFTVVPDAYAATIIHRTIIAMAATLGVLALMRRLLPPALALSVAIWWAVLPINFDTLYEVHLFALLPFSPPVSWSPIAIHPAAGEARCNPAWSDGAHAERADRRECALCPHMRAP